MNPLVTPLVLKQGEALAQSGMKEGIAAVNQKGSRRKNGNSASPEEMLSFANILSGTMAKTGGNGALKSEKNAALLQMKAQVQTKGTGAEGAGKAKNRTGLEGKISTENPLETKIASQKRIVAEKAARAAESAEGLQEELREAQKSAGKETAAAKADESMLKSGKKLEKAVKTAAEPPDRASAAPPEADKETSAETGSVRSRKGPVKAAVKEDKAAQKLNATEVLLNRAQDVKSPKTSLAGASEFTHEKGKTEKGSLKVDKTQFKDAGASQGQKKTEAHRTEVSRSDAANIKDRTEGAKIPGAESRAPLTDGTGRPEDRFANILQARSESVTGRVVENAGPLRPQVIIPQIVDGASNVLRGGSGRVVITLHPPQLGTLDMDIQVRDNKVSMIMLADSHEVKQVLESGLTQLKNALSDQGFQIDRVDVLVQDRSGNEFAGMLHERGASPEGRGQPERGGHSAQAADTASGEARRGPDGDESRLVNVFV